MSMRIAMLALSCAAAVRADPMASDLAYARNAPGSQIGVSLGLGGGVTSFSGGALKEGSSAGGSWELRITGGTRLFLAGEAAYVGTRRSLSLPGASGVTAGETPHLFSHGIEGALRLQVPYERGAWLIEPFAFGGLGWNHVGVDATIAAGNDNLRSSDDILVIPVGAGLAAAWNGVVLEGRFTYRATSGAGLLRNADGTFASLNSWAVGGLIGYEF